MGKVKYIKRKELIVSISVIVFILFIALTVAAIIDNSRKVDFEDETMGEMIAKSVRLKSAEELRVDDLEKITELNIGYTSFYDTLVDIEKCQNLKSVYISCPYSRGVFYPFLGRKMPEPELESKERIKQIEKELGNILERCPNVEDIYISDEKRCCELDNIEFLKKGKNLGIIYLYAQKDIDYSPISECKELVVLVLRQCDVSDLSMLSELENLKLLYLEGTNISDVEELLKLKNLNNLEITLTDTPLAEKKDELESLQQQFPGLDIRTD